MTPEQVEKKTRQITVDLHSEAQKIAREFHEKFGDRTTSLLDGVNPTNPLDVHGAMKGQADMIDAMKGQADMMDWIGQTLDRVISRYPAHLQAPIAFQFGLFFCNAMSEVGLEVALHDN